MSVAEQQVPISGHWEAEVGVVKLPRCANPECQAPHPLASNHWKRAFADNSVCPACGEPVPAPGREQLASTYLNLPWLVRIPMWIGRKLHALARRIEP